MEIIEQSFSKRGVRVVIERHYCPDSLRVPYLTVRYGSGWAPGRVAYFLENDLGKAEAELVRDRFLADCDTLGHLIESRQVSRSAHVAA